VVGRAPVSNRTDVNAAVAAAERAFVTWGKTTPSVRQQALLKLADAIEAHSDEIVEAQCRNTGQPYESNSKLRIRRRESSAPRHRKADAC